MTKWAINFNRDIDLQNWEYLWKTSNKISTYFQIKGSIFKIHSRWYMTPSKLARMVPNSARSVGIILEPFIIYGGSV